MLYKGQKNIVRTNLLMGTFIILVLETLRNILSLVPDILHLGAKGPPLPWRVISLYRFRSARLTRMQAIQISQS